MAGYTGLESFLSSGSSFGSKLAGSAGAFKDIGGAVSDLFAGDANAEAARFRAKGSEFEKENYGLAAGLADLNAQYTENATAIKQMQAERNLTMNLGETRADVAASGFAASGSALDILRDSASQGALQRQVIGEQGLITEAGYKEQAQSYRNMEAAAQVAIDADNAAAKSDETSGMIGAVTKGISAAIQIGSLFL